jgi:hypothetical protein
VQPFLRRGIEDPAGLKRGIVVAMPRLLFALLPVLAAIIALFYRGRRYPEHLYFAVHLGAFLFLALAVPKVAEFTRLAPIAIAAGVLVMAWIPTYAILAFRRVYGGSLVATLAKGACIAALYGTVSTVAFVAVLYWVAVAG